MKKLKEIEYDILRYRVPDVYRNKYDYLFDKNRIFYGQGCYMTHKVDKLNIRDNMVTAVVHGTIDYNVKITFLANDEINVSCECPYHKNTNKYCKHVYAVLIAVHMEDIRKEYIQEFYDNLDKVKQIMDDYSNLLKENKKYLSFSTAAFLPSTPVPYLNSIRQLKEKFDTSKEHIILNLTGKSRLELKLAIDSYNHLVDSIIRDKKEYEEYQKKKEQEKSNVKEVTFEIGPDEDALFDYLDDVMASQDIRVLKKAKAKLIEEGQSYDLIDKAIQEHKRRDRVLIQKRLKEQMREDAIKRKNRKRLRKALFRGILSGFFGSLGSSSSNPDLMPWEQDYIDKGDYEPYQFEEEELEEDDFYNEDD